MSNEIEKFVGNLGDAVKTVPDIYDDGLKPATQESGKTLALIPRTINAALVPLRQWIAGKEYNLAETEKLLAKKLEQVGEDKIVTPEPYVAVPAIQSISYSMNSEELRNLYANLLAKSMNVDTKDSVHPSFVEIIKQMSPIDALIFKEIMISPARPLITIVQKSHKIGNVYIYEHCSWIQNFSLQQSRTSFDNLTRLGLINISSDRAYTEKKYYELVKQNPLFIKARETAFQKLPTDESLYDIELFIDINELSYLFYKICVLD